MKVVSGALLMALVIPAFALDLSKASSIANDLDTFVQGLGYASNTTSAQAFESQASGYFGGGDLYVRNPVREYQLITLDPPSVASGCNGIDLHLGSLSYISNAKLVELGKSIMGSSGAYAVDVMLASTVPSLKSVRDFLQAAVQKANQMSINSCETAQTLVGGLWPKTAASQQKICNDQRRFGVGEAHDYVSARMDCAGSLYKETMAKAQKENNPAVVINRNIVWSLIHDKAFLNGNSQMAEMVMSLTGTYIIDEDGKIKNVPSLASNEDFIYGLIGEAPLNNTIDSNKETPQTQTIKIWQCQDVDKCLNIGDKPVDVALSKDQSLKGQVSSIIHSIDSKLKSDTPLDNKEKSFLAMTSLPVMKFLMVLNSTQYGNAAVDMDEYSVLIAEDLMQRYLSQLLEGVSQATMGSALNEDLLKDIQKRVDTASKKIAAINPRISGKLEQKLGLIQNIARIEKQLAAGLSGGLS